MSSQEGLIAFILIITEIGREHELVERIRELASEVGVEAEAYVVYGEYDIAVKAITDNPRKLDKFVTSLRSLPGILRTLTLISASS